MPSACGVTWSGTSGGKLDESAIPDDDFSSHYLNSGDTKSDSSFPVVDAEGNLRAGNVRSAWKLRNQGEGVSEDCLRRLASAFGEDNTPLPESAYNNMDYGMNISFSAPPIATLGDGFNEYGVRTNDDGSLDVRFNAMEPGVRRGVEITPDFLQSVISHRYDRIPLQLDHSNDQRANAGYIEPSNLQFNNFLQVQARIPNTGSAVRNDIIADFQHEPPQITDISVSFYPDSVRVDPPEKRGDPPSFRDGRIREFSLTPFPAGYDHGGLTPAFSEAVEAITASFTEDREDSPPEPDGRSHLITRPSKLYKQ